MQPSDFEKQHLLGSHGEAGGPVMVVVGGVHGNERAGVVAGRQILSQLQADATPLSGKLYCVAANLPALVARRRFLDEDLNRIWRPEVLQDAPGDSPIRERQQMAQLIGLFERFDAEAEGPITVVDLHSTSAGGAPFVGFIDTPRNRDIALATSIPAIFGLDRLLRGAMLEHLDARGYESLLIEGGEHRAKHTVANMVCGVWSCLVAAGLCEASHAPDLSEDRRRIAEQCVGHPVMVEAFHRHPFSPEDGFRMEPGFDNFAPVEQGQLLAHDKNGPIYAPESGRLLMPLYQGEGEDGFLLARDVER